MPQAIELNPASCALQRCLRGRACKTFIYDRMRDGTFPKQIRCSRTVVWNEQEVTKWMADRIQMTPTGGGPKYQQNSLKAGTYSAAFLCLPEIVRGIFLRGLDETTSTTFSVLWYLLWYFRHDLGNPSHAVKLVPFRAKSIPPSYSSLPRKSPKSHSPARVDFHA